MSIVSYVISSFGWLSNFIAHASRSFSMVDFLFRDHREVSPMGTRNPNASSHR